MFCAHKITPALRSQSVVNLKPALKFDRPYAIRFNRPEPKDAKV